VWQQAIGLAQGVAEQTLSEQRQVLAAERERVAVVEDQARQDAPLARQHAMAAQAAQQVSETRLADLEVHLEQRSTQIQDLQQRDSLLRERGDAQEHSQTLHKELQELRLKAEQARTEQQRCTRDLEDRAYREIDLAREEGKALAIQLKEANRRLQASQQALVVVQADLADAREQRGSAQARSEALQRECDLAQQAYVSERQQPQLIHRELTEARELTAVLRIRAEILEQQFVKAALIPVTDERSIVPRKLRGTR
jgi:hypothetical protein